MSKKSFKPDQSIFARCAQHKKKIISVESEDKKNKKKNLRLKTVGLRDLVGTYSIDFIALLMLVAGTHTMLNDVGFAFGDTAAAWNFAKKKNVSEQLSVCSE